MSLIQSVQLSIPDMTCVSCRAKVHAALRDVDGVKKIDIRLAERKAVVEYDILAASVEDLQLALLEADYPSEVVKSQGAMQLG